MSKLIQTLLGAGVLVAMLLFYFVLVPPDHAPLSVLQWGLLGGLAVALGLAAFLPGLLRQRRGLPQQALSHSGLKFALAVVAVLCPLAFFAVWAFGPFGSFVIVLAPIAFIIRSPRRSQPDHK